MSEPIPSMDELMQRNQILEVENMKLRKALSHMVSEWCEIIGDESENSTPADTLEKARAALAATEKP